MAGYTTDDPAALGEPGAIFVSRTGDQIYVPERRKRTMAAVERNMQAATREPPPGLDVAGMNAAEFGTDASLDRIVGILAEKKRQDPALYAKVLEDLLVHGVAGAQGPDGPPSISGLGADAPPAEGSFLDEAVDKRLAEPEPEPAPVIGTPTPT